MSSGVWSISRALRKDETGAAMVEFSLIVTLLLALTGGLVEFTLLFSQWNAASKAMHLGVRLASVSDPVASNVKTLVDSGAPGTPWTTAYKFTCTSGGCDNGGTLDSAALNTLIYGRGNTTCGTRGADNFPGMCDFFPRIRPENVIITYEHTGLGFAGRPGGPVPTITLELTGLTYDFVLLDMVPGLSSVTMPSMRTTATGEDLGTSWSSPVP